jgi:hypothetical protein
VVPSVFEDIAYTLMNTAKIATALSAITARFPRSGPRVSSTMSEKSMATGRDVLLPDDIMSGGGSEGLLGGGGNGAAAAGGSPIPFIGIALLGDEDIAGAMADGGGGNGAALGMVCDHIGGACSGAGVGAASRTGGAGRLPGGKLPAPDAPRDKPSTRPMGSQSSMPPRQTKVRLLSLPARRSASRLSCDIMRRSRAVT